MGVICAREQVRWDMGLEERGWVALGGREVCCGVGSGLGTTLGERVLLLGYKKSLVWEVRRKG